MRFSLTFLIGCSMTMACAASLAAQATDEEAPPSGAAAVAVDSVRSAYLRGADSLALATADSAMAHGLGSTELQSWRLVALVRRPIPGVTPMRTARRMASMHPTSSVAWMALAVAASATPDSGTVAREAAQKSVGLAPDDMAVRTTVTAALRRAGYNDAADTFDTAKR